jgi:hypothetical protein
MEFDQSPLMKLEQSSVAEDGQRLAQQVGHETDRTDCRFSVQAGNAEELSNTPQFQRRGIRGLPRGRGGGRGGRGRGGRIGSTVHDGPSRG